MTLPPLLGAAFPPSGITSTAELVALAALQTAIDEVIAPLAVEHDATGRYPTRAVAALKASGIGALGVPAALGGIGSSHRASLEAQVRLAAADSAVAQVFKIHDELVREIVVYCPDAMRPWLADQCVHKHTCVGLAVAEAGKRVDDPWSTVAMPTDDGGCVIDGQKIYTTGAAEADLVAVWAFDPVAGADNPFLGFRLSLVPAGTPGMTIHRDWDALGQRATDSGTVTFTSVVVPPEMRASEPGRAPLPQNSLRYQAGFAAVLVGIGVGALRQAVPFVSGRARPWPSAGVDSATGDPMVQRLCGELVADLAAAYALTMATGDLLDAFERGEIDRTALAVPIYAAKSAASRAAVRATTDLYAMLGTRGAAASTGFDRWWRNARTLSLHDPVDWKHAEIGLHVLTGWDPPPGIYT
jgi:alkylation response protein AidB-like acyl-CoA dehydrogenase